MHVSRTWLTLITIWMTRPKFDCIGNGSSSEGRKDGKNPNPTMNAFQAPLGGVLSITCVNATLSTTAPTLSVKLKSWMNHGHL